MESPLSFSLATIEVRQSVSAATCSAELESRLVVAVGAGLVPVRQASPWSAKVTPFVASRSGQGLDPLYERRRLASAFCITRCCAMQTRIACLSDRSTNCRATHIFQKMNGPVASPRTPANMTLTEPAEIEVKSS